MTAKAKKKYVNVYRAEIHGVAPLLAALSPDGGHDSEAAAACLEKLIEVADVRAITIELEAPDEYELREQVEAIEVEIRSYGFNLIVPRPQPHGQREIEEES